jgi:alpha-1,2-mannosyltransferase
MTQRPFDFAQGRSVGTALLWVLAAASMALLLYEVATLIRAVLMPLIANPQALQTDFHYYYEAAQRFSTNTSGGSRLYSMTDDVIAGFAYPPPAIVPFIWLAKFPLGTALLAFTITSYLVLVASLQQWLGYLKRSGIAIDRRESVAIIIIALALGPTYMNAVFGQVNAFVLATAVAFMCLAPAAVLEAAMLLALGIWLKIYPIVLAAAAIWDRRMWRALAWSIVALLLIAAVTMAIVPYREFGVFFRDVLPARADKTAIHIVNQSLLGFLERFRYPTELFVNWTGHEAVTVSPALRLANAGFAVAAIAAMWRRHSGVLNAASLIALIAVIAPLGWGHTYVMVLPLVVYQLMAMTRASSNLAIVIFLCVLALMVPAGRRLPIDWAPDWLENVVYSRYLIATMALMMISTAVGRKTESGSVISSA